MNRPDSEGDATGPAFRIGARLDSGTKFGRYEIVRHLGQGGNGVVYEALDSRSGNRVALKTLKAVQPQRLYRFKKEFRSLAELSHRNVVKLHELVVEGSDAYFTMELVEGTDLLRYLREGCPADTAPSSARVRRAFRQLLEGVVALHESGKLHRDIKPSNIMVDREGRVVLLDFGLAREDISEVEEATITDQLAGTPHYMSPEQAETAPLTEASDLYSIGVVLYEVLTGRRPYPGSGMAALFAKQKTDPPPPVEIVPTVPAELNRLCLDLLNRNPKRRPAPKDIFDRLGGSTHDTGKYPRVGSPSAAPFVGRQQELARLDAAFNEVRHGVPRTLFVGGRSGIGKTTLIRRFLSELRADKQVVVLRGRCFDRESVPYKGIDELVDALSHFLVSLPEAEAAALLPRRIDAVSRLFPVLERVSVIQSSRSRIMRRPDPEELRKSAVAALRELFARIGDRWPLAVHIDDLQWADLDSARLLCDLLRGDDPPAMLLLAGYRTEFVGHSEPLAVVLDAGLGDPEHMIVGPLSDDESLQLARKLGDGLDQEAVQEAARAADGSPFFLSQYLRAGQLAVGSDTSITTVLVGRLDGLSEGARELLRTVCVAGGPVDWRVCATALDLPVEDETLVRALEAGEFILATRADEVVVLEPVHDQIREFVTAGLTAEERTRTHGALARALQEHGSRDVEQMAEHFRHAGDDENAALYAEQAGELAADALAFERALYLLRQAVRLRGDDASVELRKKYADALAHAGHGGKAATEYRALVPVTSDRDARALQVRAASELLRTGHISEGLSVIEGVLHSVGMQLPATKWRAIGALLFHRARIFLRGGLRYRERAAEDIPAEELDRIDIAWAVANGLVGMDSIKGAAYQSLQLLLALRSGEPYRVGRAIAFEALIASQTGGRALERCLRLVKRAEEIGERHDQPHVLGWAKLSKGAGLMFVRRWKESVECCGEAERILSGCAGASWELTSARQLRFSCLYHLGEFRELARTLPVFTDHARERGDLYATVQVATLSSLLKLIAGDPTGARAVLDETFGNWAQDGFQVPHFSGMLTRLGVDIYEGKGEEALAHADAQWPVVEKSMLLFVDFLRTTALDHRGRALVLVALNGEGEAKKKAIARAKADAKTIGDQHHAGALSQIILGGVACASGDLERAKGHFRAAADGFEAAEMRLHAAAARWRVGKMVGGEKGRSLWVASEATLAAEGVADPAKYAAMIAPGSE